MNFTGHIYEPDWQENPTGKYQDHEYVVFHDGYDEGFKAGVDYALNEINTHSSR